MAAARPEPARVYPDRHRTAQSNALAGAHERLDVAEPTFGGAAESAPSTQFSTALEAMSGPIWCAPQVSSVSSLGWAMLLSALHSPSGPLQ